MVLTMGKKVSLLNSNRSSTKPGSKLYKELVCMMMEHHNSTLLKIVQRYKFTAILVTQGVIGHICGRVVFFSQILQFQAAPKQHAERQGPSKKGSVLW